MIPGDHCSHWLSGTVVENDHHLCGDQGSQQGRGDAVELDVVFGQPQLLQDHDDDKAGSEVERDRCDRLCLFDEAVKDFHAGTSWTNAATR